MFSITPDIGQNGSNWSTAEAWNIEGIGEEDVSYHIITEDGEKYVVVRRHWNWDVDPVVLITDGTGFCSVFDALRWANKHLPTIERLRTLRCCHCNSIISSTYKGTMPQPAVSPLLDCNCVTLRPGQVLCEDCIEEILRIGEEVRQQSCQQ